MNENRTFYFMEESFCSLLQQFGSRDHVGWMCINRLSLKKKPFSQVEHCHRKRSELVLCGDSNRHPVSTNTTETWNGKSVRARTWGGVLEGKKVFLAAVNKNWQQLV